MKRDENGKNLRCKKMHNRMKNSNQRIEMSVVLWIIIEGHKTKNARLRKTQNLDGK